ncbi:MAG: hypothetical protein HY921_02485 [Elusimicrobia bacterium]|nr:hypothetical protein [Elusimicrobiota bacterium]
MIERLKTALPPWTLGAFFGLLSALFLSRQYDASAFTYVVVAEEGLWKVHQTAHPLYVPLLRGVALLLRALGFQGKLLPVFQLLSLLAAAAWLALLCRLCLRFTKTPWVAGAAALALAAQRHPWIFSMQTKPYMLGALLATAALLALTAENNTTKPLPILLTALAAGFDMANLALIPLGAWLLRRRGPGQAWAFAAISVGLCGLYGFTMPAGPLAALKAMYAPPHFEKTSLYRNPDLLAMPLVYARWLAGRLPESLFVLPVFLSAAPAARRLCSDACARRAFSWAAAIFAAYSAVFILFHAADDYAFCAALGLPLVLAALADRVPAGKPLLAAGTLAIAGFSFFTAIFPRSRPWRDPIQIEGNFLLEKMGSRDLLAMAGAPDWIFGYLYRDRLRMIRFDAGSGQSAAFSAAKLDIHARAFGEISGTLKRGGLCFLAADSYFRPSDVFSSPEIDAYQARVQRELLKRFRLGPPLISPQGQWYVPIMAK